MAALLVLSALVGAGWFGVRWAMESRLPLALLEEHLGRALRMRVEISTMTVAPSGTVVLEGLRARDSQGREILFSPRTRAEIPPGDALRGRPTVEDLVLEGPRVTLDRQRLASLPRGEAGGVPFPIRFENGTLNWIEGPRPLVLREVTGRVAAAPPGAPVEVRVSAEGIQGLVVTVRTRGESWEATARFEEIQERLLRHLAGLAPAKEPGTLAGEIQLSGQGPLLQARARLVAATSWARGPLVIQAVQKEGSRSGTVSSPGVEIPGLGRVEDLHVPFVHRKEFTIRGARLVLPQGRLAVDGTIGVGGEMTLEVRSEALDVFALRGLQGLGLQASPARVDVRLRPAGANTSFQGTLAWKEIGTARQGMRDAWVRGQGTWSRDAVRVSRLVVGRGPTDSVPLVEGAGVLVPGVRVEARVDRAVLAQVASLFPQAAGLELEGLSSKGTLLADLRTGRSSGTVLGGPGSAAGVAVEGLRLDFQGAKGKPLALGGAIQLAGQRLALSGTVPGRLALSGAGLPLQRLPLVGARLPGWTGTVDATLRLDPVTRAASYDLVARNLKDRGRPIPDISARGQGSAARLVVESGAVALTPPLPFEGTLDLEKSRLDLSATLQGQTVEQLARFVPALKGMSGRLEGPLTVRGPFARPAISFDGRVRQATVAAIPVQEARVQVTLPAPSQMRLTATMEALPFQSVPALKAAVPDLAGAARVQVRTSDPAQGYTIDLRAPTATFRGQALGEVRGRMLWRGAELRVQDLSLPLSPPLHVTGTILPRMRLQARLEGQDLARLASFLPGEVPEVGGRAFGDLRVDGTARALGVAFHGRGEGLRFAGQGFGAATLRLDVTRRGTAMDGVLEAGGLRAETTSAVQSLLAGTKGALSGSVAFRTGRSPLVNFRLEEGAWQGKALPPLQGRLAWGSETVQVQELRVGLSPPVTLSGVLRPTTKGFDLSGKLQGSRLKDLLALAPAGLPDLEGRLEGPLTMGGAGPTMSLGFRGTLSDLVAGGVQIGTGEVSATVNRTGEVVRTALRGEGFDAGRVAPLAARYPGLRGALSFEGDVGPEGTDFQARLQEASMQAGPVPELQGVFLLQGDVLNVQSLRAALDPPLELSGQYRVGGGNLELHGQLGGQSLGDLIRLAGGRPPEDLAGRLSGPVGLSGTSSAPVLDFHGRITELTLKGINLGAGEVAVRVAEGLEGNVTLDQPVSLGAVGGLAGPLGRLPMLQGLLDSTGVQILGASLGGSPVDPKITPRFAGLQSLPGRKLQLPVPFNLQIPGRP